MAAVPISLAAPATAAALAYLNARWRLPEDRRLLGSVMLATRSFQKRLKADRANAFYVLEDQVKNPKVADKPFVVYQGKTWTFKETHNMALRYAGWLHSTHQVVQGEFVAINFMNCPQFIFLSLAVWSLGAVPALINYNLTGPALIHSLRTSTARLLIIEPEVEAKVLTPEIITAVTSPTFRNNAFPLEVVVLDAGLQSSLDYFPPYRAPDSARKGVIGRFPGTLISTSGTTGLPKAAIVSLERLAVSTEFVGRWMGLRPVTSSNPDRYYSAMPLYHSSAFMLAFCMCMIRGVTLVIGRKFSVSTFWSDAAAGNATAIQYVGETLRYLLAAPPSPDDKTRHNVRLAFGNGLRRDVWERFRSRFGVATLAEFYGATEGTAGVLNFSRNTFSSGAIAGHGVITDLLFGLTCALVVVDWDTEMPLRSPTTGFCTRVKPGEAGEYICAVDAADISAKFQGYHNNPAASNSKILRNVFKKGDAWYRSGDVMRHDSDGRLWFSDRIGDTFRWKSENVSTAEVAEVLGSHPLVLDANVYGVTVPGQEGRAGCAAILLQDSAFRSDNSKESNKGVRAVKDEVLKSLATHSQNSLPKYAVPVFLRVVSEVVATGNNKQQKTALRNEGIDPQRTGSDRVFWLPPGKERYEAFGVVEWDALRRGGVKL